MSDKGVDYLNITFSHTKVTSKNSGPCSFETFCEKSPPKKFSHMYACIRPRPAGANHVLIRRKVLSDKMMINVAFSARFIGFFL